MKFSKRNGYAESFCLNAFCWDVLYECKCASGWIIMCVVSTCASVRLCKCIIFWMLRWNTKCPEGLEWKKYISWFIYFSSMQIHFYIWKSCFPNFFISNFVFMFVLSLFCSYTVEYFSSDLQTGWVVAVHRFPGHTFTVSILSVFFRILKILFFSPIFFIFFFFFYFCFTFCMLLLLRMPPPAPFSITFWHSLSWQ